MFLIYCVGKNQLQKKKKKQLKSKNIVSINKKNETLQIFDTDQTQQDKQGADEVYNDVDDDKNTEYIRNIFEEDGKKDFMAASKKEDDQDVKGSQINIKDLDSESEFGIKDNGIFGNHKDFVRYVSDRSSVSSKG